MKIVITAQEPTMEASLDPRFGRAKYFLVVDTETGEFAARDNEQNLNAPQGAGIQAAAQVAELGAGAVITGNVGPKAFQALQAAKIPVYKGPSGTVAEAAEAFRAGKVEQLVEASVEGHWV